jgi:hypothetical protein
MQVVYLVVRVELEDTVDLEDFVENVDYDFSYPGVEDTEIIGTTDPTGVV